MTKIAAHDLEFWPPHAHDAAAAIVALSEGTRHTVEIAAGLVRGGRRVDLAGLDRMVSLLCAKALDLSAVEGRAARAGLIVLLTEIDALSLALRAGGS